MAVDWSRIVIGPNIGVFGDPATYNTRVLTFPITGVFDRAYLELAPLGRGGEDMESFSMGSPGAISAERPVLGVQLSQFLAPPKQGDTLTITGGLHAGERYEVKEVRADGHGGAKLLLNEYRGI